MILSRYMTLLLGIFFSVPAEAVQVGDIDWGELSFEEMSVAQLIKPSVQSLQDFTSKLRDSEALNEFSGNAEQLLIKANTKEWNRALDDPSTTFPYLVCRETSSGESSYEAAKQLIALLKEKEGTDETVSMEPVLNTADTFCVILHTLGRVALRTGLEDPSWIFQPYLNSFKLVKNTWDALYKIDDAKGFRSLDFGLCPSAVQELSNSTLADKALTMLLNATLLKEAIVFWDEDDEDVPNREFWDNIFQYLEQGVCSQVIEERLEWEYDAVGGVLSLTVNGDTLTDSLCSIAVTASVMVLPQVCSISIRAPLKTRNKRVQWLAQSGIEEERPMHDFDIMGEGQVITVSDTGLDTKNCYFNDNDESVIFDRWGGQGNPNHRKVVAYKTSPGDSFDYEYGHGTHVVGTIVGSQGDPYNPNKGMVPGMAPKAKVAFMDLGRGDVLYGAAATTIADMGRPDAKIHSASWGDFPYDTSYTHQAQQFDKYMYENDDFLMILAAGNDGYGDGRGTIGSPATSKNCISVGASHSYGNDLDPGFLGLFGFQKGPNHLADFSSRGPTFDGRNKPDLIAPGKYVLSAGAQPYNPFSCDPNSEPSVGGGKGGVKSMAGTSMAGTRMATPVTAGHAALVREYFEKGLYTTHFPDEYPMPDLDSPIISGALVKAILMNGAQYLGYVGGGKGPQELKPYDYNQNYGRISMIDSVYLPGKSNRQIQVWDRQTIAATGSDSIQTFDITIDQSQGCASKVLSVTLVWMDKEADYYCKHCLINDLDMTLQRTTNDKPTQQLYHPNGRNSPDTKNNAERIQILDATDGQTFRITINGEKVVTLNGYQKYALVATGCFGGVAQTLDTSKDVYANDNSDQKQTNIIIGFAIGGVCLLLAFFGGPICLKKYRTRRAAKQKEQKLMEEQQDPSTNPEEDMEKQPQDQPVAAEEEPEFDLGEEEKAPTATIASTEGGREPGEQQQEEDEVNAPPQDVEKKPSLDEQVASILAESDEHDDLDVSAVLSDPDHDAVFEDPHDDDSHGAVEEQDIPTEEENATAEENADKTSEAIKTDMSHM